jgi:hypothetical protein
MVSEDDQDKQHPQLNGGNGKEVDRDQVADMVREERAPGLRGRGRTLRDEARDRALCHFNAKLEESPWMRGAPQRIGGGHFSDEGADVGVDGRATHGAPAGELGPVLAETAPLPT